MTYAYCKHNQIHIHRGRTGAEAGIGELKKKMMQFMSATRTPEFLWDYYAQYAAEIISLTASFLYTLHGRTPLEMVTRQTPDISEYLDFTWYEPLWHFEEAGFPDECHITGFWLGVAHRVGQALCYWILTESSNVIACTTVQLVTPDELHSLLIQERIQEFDEKVRTKLGHAMEITDDAHPKGNTFLQDVDEGIFKPVEPEAKMSEADEFDADTYDKYLVAQVLLPKGDLMMSGQVIRCKHDQNGDPIGHTNPNLILDTRVFEIQLPDGHVEDYAVNVIPECLYSQLDDEGFQ